jgi:hypothetical protein
MAAITNRHVHFGDLNWEDEDKRTQKGMKVRRERRQKNRERRQKKHLLKIDEARRTKEAFGILLDSGNNLELLELCNNSPLLCAIFDFFLIWERIGDFNGDRGQRLQALQVDRRIEFRFQGLDDHARQALLSIRRLKCFVSSFFHAPGNVSDSSTSTNDELVAAMEDAVGEEADENIEDQQAAAAAVRPAAPNNGRRRPRPPQLELQPRQVRRRH